MGLKFYVLWPNISPALVDIITLEISDLVYILINILDGFCGFHACCSKNPFFSVVSLGGSFNGDEVFISHSDSQSSAFSLAEKVSGVNPFIMFSELVSFF
jgi:hypothetical protein